jgi:hypothetical protein
MIDGHQPQVIPSGRLAVDVRLPDRVLERKVDALLALGSQTGPIVDELGLDRFAAWVATEHFVAASGATRVRASGVRGRGDRSIGHSERPIDDLRRQEQP